MINGKRVFYISGNSSPYLAGGAIVSTNAIANEFKNNNIEIIAVASRNLKEKNSDVISFDRFGYLSYNPLVTFSVKELFENLKGAFSVLKYFTKNTLGLKRMIKPGDLIINNGHWCKDSDIVVIRYCFKSFLRKLDIVQSHSPLYRLFDLKTLTLLFLERQILRSERVKAVVTLSNESKNDFIKSYPDFKKKIVVIPNGVDRERYDFSQMNRELIREELGIHPKDIVILFSGHNIVRKNLRGVIEVYNQVKDKDIHLVILSRKDKLDASYGDLLNDKNIHFVDWTDHPEFYYSAGDILMFPTIYDTGTKVILESIVIGNYVVVSKSSGVGEFIPKGQGTAISGEFSVSKYAHHLRIYISKCRTGNRPSYQDNRILTWSEVAKLYLKLLNTL